MRTLAAATLVVLLTGCASTNTPRSDVLAWPADVACSLPEPTGIVSLASCGASLAIRSLSPWVDKDGIENVQRRPGLPTSGGNWDAPEPTK